MSETNRDLIVAIDQGTSSTKALVMDATGAAVSHASTNVTQNHPRPGWVEQDPEEIYQSVLSAYWKALEGVSGSVAAIGISSQRESAVVWDRRTGTALAPVLGWQDRRTIGIAQGLEAAGAAMVREVTGLPLDPMFSALKLDWLLDSVDPTRRRARSGELAVGTVDSWLLFRLTGEHRIEIGNASRTQLLDLTTHKWSDSLLELFDIPRECLPRVVASDEPSEPVGFLGNRGRPTRIHAVMGDSHAALYGHGARRPGQVKVTYGTGSSIMGLVPESSTSVSGLARSIAWKTDRVLYAFEGNILSSGATLLWVAQLLDIDASEVDALARSVDDAGGVHLVPAFAGLGAPWWDDHAVATMSGFDLGASRGRLSRAAMESIAFQIEDVLERADAVAARVDPVLVDGGPTSNQWLMQLQSDLSQRTIVRSLVAELSAVGVAHLAGRSCELWTEAQVAGFATEQQTFRPRLDPRAAEDQRRAWSRAVSRARFTSTPEEKAQRSPS